MKPTFRYRQLLFSSQADDSQIFDLAVGGYLVFIGVLYVMMHYGVLEAQLDGV